MRGASDLQGIVSLLDALESGEKLVSVEAVSIAPANRIAGAAARDDEVLGIVMTVNGYAMAEVGER